MSLGVEVWDDVRYEREPEWCIEWVGARKRVAGGAMRGRGEAADEG